MTTLAPEFGPSKGAVDRAGVALRAWWDGCEKEKGNPLPADPTDLLFAFRAEFQNPMKKVTVGLRQFVVRECDPDVPVTVGQRLKRAPQIVEKLSRHPRMKLSRMQDIGGCRAILQGGHDEVRRVAVRIERNWTIKHQKHYTLAEPAPSGYRALHIVVERDGRLIEIQLRTPREHDWAEAIERTDKRLGLDLKSGRGPRVLLDYFRRAADGLAMEDAGVTPGLGFMRDFGRARDAARPYFTRE
jgi:putative GTP pyrophosphokinase